MWPLYYRPQLSVGGDRRARVLVGRIPLGGRASEGEDRHRVRRVRAVDSGAEGRAAHAPARAVPRLAAARPGVLPRAAEEASTTRTRTSRRSTSMLVREYPGWTQESPDVVKADVILDHLREWEAKKAMPNLVMVILPSDHTVGTSPAGGARRRRASPTTTWRSARSSRGSRTRPFWKYMAILVVEDDAQDGVDHVDGHRTVALVAISLRAPRHRRLHVLQSAEHGEDDRADARPSRDSALRPRRDRHAGELHRRRRAARLTPYTALVPKQSLYEMNHARRRDHRARTRPRADARRCASARMSFDAPDEGAVGAAQSHSLARRARVEDAVSRRASARCSSRCRSTSPTTIATSLRRRGSARRRVRRRRDTRDS